MSSQCSELQCNVQMLLWQKASCSTILTFLQGFLSTVFNPDKDSLSQNPKAYSLFSSKHKDYTKKLPQNRHISKQIQKSQRYTQYSVIPIKITSASEKTPHCTLHSIPLLQPSHRKQGKNAIIYSWRNLVMSANAKTYTAQIVFKGSKLVGEILT